MSGVVGFVVIMTLYVAIGAGYGRYLYLTRWHDDDGVYKAWLVGALWPYAVPCMLAVWVAEKSARIVILRRNNP